MESQSPEESQKPTEIILDPKIIRPLGRVLEHEFLPHINAVQKTIEKLKGASGISNEYKEVLRESLNGFNLRLQKLQKAKVVKLIAGPPDPIDPDYQTWGIECSAEESEYEIIPSSTTVIDQPLMEKLGPALQDYFVTPLYAAERPYSDFPSPLTGDLETIKEHSKPVIGFLRTLTHAQEITIGNTRSRSIITSMKKSHS